MINSNTDYIAELFFNTDTNLYDLTLTTFNGNTNPLNFNFFICERRHAGRLDLVASEIYDNNKWIGSLCAINDIYNQFSIRDGDIIFYLPESDLQGLIKVPEIVSGVISNIKNDLIKALKKKKPDPSRKNYLNNRTDDKLPPTVLPETAPQIVVENNKIKIAPNLFQDPNSEPTTTTVDNTSPLNNAPSSPIATEDQIQRILVRRYIKTTNQ